MNKKIFGIMITILAVSLILTPLAIAAPGGNKTNEKFLSFELTKVSGTPAAPPIIINHPEPPKETEMRRLIIQERMSAAEMIINGGDPYLLNEDFTYEAILTIDYHLNHNPLFCTITVDQTFVFLPDSGIEGSLEVLAKGKFWPNGKDGSSDPESWTVNNGHGTLDLEGVKLSSVAYHTAPGVIHYEGTITNWPTS